MNASIRAIALGHGGATPVASRAAVLRALLCISVLAVVWGLGAPAGAQDLPGMQQAAPADTPAAEPTSADAIAARAQAVAQELAAAEAALSKAVDAADRAHFSEVRDELGRIDSLLRRQLEQLSVGDAEPAPLAPPGDLGLSVFELNELYELQFEAERRRDRLVEADAVSRAALVSAKEKFEEAERSRREARSEFEAASPGARASAARTLELRRLASRSAEERLHLRTLETRATRSRLAQAQDGEGLEVPIAELRKELAEGEGDAARGLDALAQRESDLTTERRTLERRLSTTELRLEAAKQRFSRHTGASKEPLEEVEALTATRDALRQAIGLVDAQLEKLEAQRLLAERWDRVLRDDGTREEYEAWKQEVDERIDGLKRLELQLSGQRADLERRVDHLETRLERLPPESGLAAVLEEQRATLSELLAAEQRETVDVARDRRMSERVREDLGDRTGEIDLIGVASATAEGARDLWRYEITAVEDSPITVGSLAIALVLASAGLWASRKGSQIFGSVSRKRLKLDAGAAQALETLSFYVLLASFTMLALRAVHFPLTAFTVLGGALAIGIGFGSQNVMNNFISGLILMLERPVRAGDVVEVDSNHGTIERIGARSTQIRSTDGRHIVVPNSFFLENNLVNWTLSDDLVRTKVLVGVIYGSPTRLVEELIKKVAEDDPNVLARPAPIILFDEFGDNSLNFEVHFWVRARSPMEMRKVASGLRFAIDDLFREHGLVIAFPQRDVHLDTVAPLEVRVVSDGGSNPTEDEGR